ncbi:hypothetical protein KEM48_009439 [Puccinia striiformis f. sp. tritici PST-130]|nr:hypothetical protein H4Q26_009832 [Puccinia striiformis f. sp. tritici PST-130]KAI9623544.1 hypothetical protein KEM48_009439 [Puccinia striiformis f. sp. tritici PST-130]
MGCAAFWHVRKPFCGSLMGKDGRRSRAGCVCRTAGGEHDEYKYFRAEYTTMTPGKLKAAKAWTNRSFLIDRASSTTIIKIIDPWRLFSL